MARRPLIYKIFMDLLKERNNTCKMEEQAEIVFMSIMTLLENNVLKLGDYIDYSDYEELMSNDAFVDILRKKLYAVNLTGAVNDCISKHLYIDRC